MKIYNLTMIFDGYFNALILFKNTQNIQPILSKQSTLMLFFPKTSNKTRNPSIQYYFGVFFYRDKCRSDTTSNQRNGVGPAQQERQHFHPRMRILTFAQVAVVVCTGVYRT
jgi:hypothetical protein